MEDAEDRVVDEKSDGLSDGIDEEEGDGIGDVSQLGAGGVEIKSQTVHQESHQLVGKDTKSLAQDIVGYCQPPQGELPAASEQQRQLQQASSDYPDGRTDHAHLPTSTSCVVPKTRPHQVPGTTALTPASTTSSLSRVPGSYVSQIEPSGRSEIQLPGNSLAVTQYKVRVQQQFGDVTVKGGKNLNIGGTQNVGITPAKPKEEEKPLTSAHKIRSELSDKHVLIDFTSEGNIGSTRTVK
ncbi:uncharacterized protein [Haliotis asinina]|uniref:uncharacterized protein n=1 Tax=Haliotis asinina TaxID=109174 RepID=UPI003531896E